MSTPSMMKSTSPDSKTKFEQDLETYFPEIHQFHMLFKYDKFYRQLLDGILSMVNNNSYGRIEIIYQRGKINYVNKTEQLTADTSPNLTKPKTRL